MRPVKESRLLTVALAVVMAALLLSASIAAPILCRPFYYAHIDALRLTETTPWSEGEIRQAFDEMLDFCVGKTDEFSTGALAWSDWGRSHFEDVKVLFLLDLRVAAGSLVLLAALLIGARLAGRRPRPILGRGPGFWTGTGLAAVFLLIAGWAALDFQRAFVAFHAVFFPGKENWILDGGVDEIINILPAVFFRNCAILILVLLVLGCAVLIAGDVIYQRKRRKREAP